MPPIDAEIHYKEVLTDRGTGRDHGDVRRQKAGLGTGRCDLVWLVGKDSIAMNFCQFGALLRRQIRHLFNRTGRRVLRQRLRHPSHGNFSRCSRGISKGEP
jgi:hypothetical protein